MASAPEETELLKQTRKALRKIMSRRRNMLVLSPRLIKTVIPIALLVLAVVLVDACGGSKANVRTDESNPVQPATIDVTTATAIVRDLPQYFEASGSLIGDQQTDVAPSIAGKVVEIGVDMGSYVKRGQMIVRLDDVDSKLKVQQQQAKVDQMKASLRQAEEKVGITANQKLDLNKVPEVANARVAADLAEKHIYSS